MLTRLLLLLSLLLALRTAAATLAAPYVFTDGKAVITLDAPDITYTVKIITATGWGPTSEGKATSTTLEIAPLAEGIHIVTLATPKPQTVRFLAITPPGEINQHLVLDSLPRCGKKLLAGQPVTIVAMGDSITATGDYPGLLKMLLQRATGNTHITMVNRSYSGRSVDAACRFFREDCLATKPDLGLLMYGMNDARSGCSLDGYVDQYRWIADHLAKDCNADTVLMSPTPDCSVDEKFTAYNDNMLLPLRFGMALQPLAKELHLPYADTFAEMWGDGGPSLDASGKAMWPKFPPGYSEQFNTMLENNGRGDGVHANVLGHLSIARAVFTAMMGNRSSGPLEITATSRWTADGLVSFVTVSNFWPAHAGKLELHSFPDGPVTTDFAGDYTLDPGKTLYFKVRWPNVRKPEDLLSYPGNMYIAPGHPAFVLLDVYDGGSMLYVVDAPLANQTNYVRGRLVTTGVVPVMLRNGTKTFKNTPYTIPAGSEMGRAPLLQPTGNGAYAVAEIAYTRFAGATKGEATVDGNLDEWDNQVWSTLGEKIQARWTQGIADNRATPEECYLHWSVKAGAKGLYIAVKATGSITKDSFTLFFDTRDPKELGTPGRYYWISGALQPDNTLKLDRGETSPAADGMTGKWQPTPDGATLEFFIPYALLESAAWPQSGDLGASLWWRHTGPGGNTNLLWAEDGHPWNPRWYGVIRLLNTPTDKLPYRVRIK